MKTKQQDLYFELYPKVVCVGKPATVTVRPKFDHVAWKDDHTYSFELSEKETYNKKAIVPERDGCKLLFNFTPSMEQEFEIVMVDEWPNGRKITRVFSVYAVDEDLIGLRPWKGDFHLHSCRSDGQESPLYVASAYRQAGFDFFALTDHHQMPPSHEVIDGMAKLDTDFKVYPGEEVHPPNNCVHHVNFGGSFSVNDLHRRGEAYEKEVDAVEATLDVPWMDAADRRRYASSCWVFQKIREAGGISIFCHPYWSWNNRYNVSEALMKGFFRDLQFDALELIGGFHRPQSESNSLQVSRWSEERAKGKKIPVVGISDSHGVETGSLFNWYYTIVLAPTAEFSDLAEAIRDERSVAIHSIDSEATQAHGPFRYVKYVYFLLREVLPLHHEECREEGRLMLKYFGGDESVAEDIARCKNRIKNLYDKLFAKA